MKKVFFLFAMFTCIFASCSDGGSEEPVTPPTQKPEVNNAPTITIDPTIQSSGLSFDVSASEKSITFSTTADWTLSIAETRSGTEWCTASPTSGGKGTATVKFKTTENTEPEDRSVAVTIKAGTASKTFTVTQKGADALLVTTTKYEVSQEGGEIEIEVKANIDYQMEISETSKSWITESASRALTTHKHIFNIAMNEDSGKREGQIIFKSGDKVETVKVYQAGGAILLLSQDEYTVSDAGETISVDVKSNVEYGVQMPDVDWIVDEASSRAMSSHTLKYVIAPNEGYDSRSAEIIFYDKNSDLKDTLKVVQAQKDAIIPAKDKYTVNSNASQLDFSIKANVDYNVNISVDWIKPVSESRALKEDKLSFVIEENTSDEAREGAINISSENVSQTIKVVQTGKLYLTFIDKELEIMEGKTVELSYSTNYSGQISWKSLDDNIATISNEGIVTGVNKGETTIVISSKDGVLSDSCKVSVKSITDYISISSGSSSIQIGNYVIRSISSTIKNTSNYDIELVLFAIYKSGTGELYTQTTDASLLGTLKAGESKSLGIDNLHETFEPQYVWEYIYEGSRYKNNEKISGSGTGSTGATGEDMPWQ